MTPKEAAVYLGISVYYLRNMRHEMHAHEGPVYTRVMGKRTKECRYAKEDLDLWAESHKWRKLRKEIISALPNDGLVDHEQLAHYNDPI
jgi:hypothetical protein